MQLSHAQHALLTLLTRDIDRVLDTCDTRELAALNYDWLAWWSRDKQRIPDGAWRSHGYLAGRRFGKSRANAEYVTHMVEAGRAPIVGIMAQTDDDAKRIQVYGDAGLIACSPPWFKARFENNEVVWPNGSRALIFTPVKPGNIRGDGVHLMWMTEIQSWPNTTGMHALQNALALCSLGEARVLWDATSKRRNQLILAMLRATLESPDKHLVVFGDILENRLNLPKDVIDDLLAKHAKRGPDGSMLRDPDGNVLLTQTGREELFAYFSLDNEGALWRDEWIVQREPTHIVDAIVSVDPAVSATRGSDETGIVVAGLDDAGLFVTLEDQSGKHRWEDWGDITLALYRKHRCTCLLVERNRGGDAVVANIRARALVESKDTRVVVLDRHKRMRPKRHDPRVIYVREVVAYNSKWTRAEPVAGLYRDGLAYHDPRGALATLEALMTTWEPAPDAPSPNQIDALTQAAAELVDLDGHALHPPDVDMHAVLRAQQQIATPTAPRAVTRTLGKSWWGSRI